MSEWHCTECFKEQRSLNDQLKQKIIDAQDYANKENIKVAVFFDGEKFSFAKISGKLPGGTRQVVEPVH